VNAFNFFKIEQNWDRRPENTPILPFLVGKAPEQLVISADFQGGFGEFQTNGGSLEQEKQPQYSDGECC
jgi:hypothetical protein